MLRCRSWETEWPFRGLQRCVNRFLLLKKSSTTAIEPFNMWGAMAWDWAVTSPLNAEDVGCLSTKCGRRACR
ncbi:hypothetical protein AMC82_PD00669 (plasmid) [Rhizobium phaseoli]|nr:hypothetical protein AMC88_PD00184 [Rhizobium phaseoli]ANL62990.1 hypothetical protein AMC85_PD00184 [Rhizobium phaseoli]ANL69628.1 hypothetical protein AMC84_PD00670 [Rhizobium phaseoli]ANL82426.1 hypothetical protein AMC82_PD00669 [Rhizobium phaseoli]